MTVTLLIGSVLAVQATAPDRPVDCEHYFDSAGRAIGLSVARLRNARAVRIRNVLSSVHARASVHCASDRTVALRTRQWAPPNTLIRGNRESVGLAHLIMRLEFVDPMDGFPVRNAEILLLDDDGLRIDATVTDDEGRAIVVFRTNYALAFHTPLALVARSPRREQWQRTFDRGELLDQAEMVGLWIPLEYFAGNIELTDEPIVDAVKKGYWSSAHLEGVPENVDRRAYGKQGAYFVWRGKIEMRRLGNSHNAPAAMNQAPPPSSVDRHAAPEEEYRPALEQSVIYVLDEWRVTPGHYPQKAEKMPARFEIIYGPQAQPQARCPRIWSLADPVGQASPATCDALDAMWGPRFSYTDRSFRGSRLGAVVGAGGRWFPSLMVRELNDTLTYFFYTATLDGIGNTTDAAAKYGKLHGELSPTAYAAPNTTSGRDPLGTSPEAGQRRTTVHLLRSYSLHLAGGLLALALFVFVLSKLNKRSGYWWS